MDKKASPIKSIGLFLGSILLILAVRWVGYEPYVIPSGSMIPTLLINDHILVSKYSFGIRWPLTRKWLMLPTLPKRGDIVVFRSIEKDDFFLIKRVIGLPGDKIDFTENGDLVVNGQVMSKSESTELQGWTEDDFDESIGNFKLFEEQLGAVTHWVLQENDSIHMVNIPHVVPPGNLFMMGDNRDRSRDSRYWGDLPIENLIGKAQFVWLSCAKTLPGVNIICDPRYIRWHRFFHKIK